MTTIEAPTVEARIEALAAQRRRNAEARLAGGLAFWGAEARNPPAHLAPDAAAWYSWVEGYDLERTAEQERAERVQLRIYRG